MALSSRTTSRELSLNSSKQRQQGWTVAKRWQQSMCSSKRAWRRSTAPPAAAFTREHGDDERSGNRSAGGSSSSEGTGSSGSSGSSSSSGGFKIGSDREAIQGVQVSHAGSSGQRDVVARLAEIFYELKRPVGARRPYSHAMQDFTVSAITAFECGHNERDICQQLQLAMLQDGGPASLGWQNADVDDLVCCIAVVWVTLISLGTTRWAAGSAVSDSTLQQWSSFVAMIMDAYLYKRMMWYPLERLRLELQLHCPASQQPLPQDVVEERVLLVFATLEQAAPMYPKG